MGDTRIDAGSRRSELLINEHIEKIMNLLDAEYGRAVCTLDYANPLHLLVSTQLSAQCTDERVNMVTPDLFKRFPTVYDLMNAKISELEDLIRSTGFFRNKAKNIKACCERLVTHFNGEVPGNMEDLISLPGVGRKTANVVLGEIFHVPGIIVDTHTGRLSRRIGLTANTAPVKVEKDLMNIIPKENWTQFSHWLVSHGRAVCKSRKPECANCTIKPFCKYGRNI